MAKSKAPAQADRDGSEFGTAEADGVQAAELEVDHKPTKKPAEPEFAPQGFGEFGTATLASPKGPLPRVCKPTERANQTAGQSRFKARGVNQSGTSPVKYILARDEAEARDCYLRTAGLRAGSDIVVTALAD